jgi:hypothetical protein
MSPLPVKFSWIIHKKVWISWRGSQPSPVRVSNKTKNLKRNVGVNQNEVRLIFFFLRMIKVKRCKRKSKEKLKNKQY